MHRQRMMGAYIIDGIRTPFGKYGGFLSLARPDDLAAKVIQGLMERNTTLPLQAIDDVILGCSNQAGEDNRNIARMAALLAGLPFDIPGQTVNRLCASGLQAIITASDGISSRNYELVIAGGVESMSRAPYVMLKADEAFGRAPSLSDSTLGWRFFNPKLKERIYPLKMGETAEKIAGKWGISREKQDEWAYRSHLKYFAALDEGKIQEELVSVKYKTRKESKESPFIDESARRDSNLEKLSSLKPAFVPGGSVTAGNSAPLNDGAAALLIAGEKAIQKYGLKPLARIVSCGIAGVHPDYMGIGPVPATQKALRKAGLKLNDIGLFEINEAFASQALACMQELETAPSTVNVNGGSIAIGHPLGSSGARISISLIMEMQRRNVRYGIATMCVGVGQGVSVIFEKC